MARKIDGGKLEFEEAVLDSLSGDFEVRESPLPQRVFRLTLFITLGLAVVFGVRVVSLGAAKNEFYSQRAFANVNRELYTIAPRGVILDRYENPLVENVPIFSLFLKPSEFFKNGEETVVAEGLEKILGMPRVSFYSLLKNSDLESTNDLLLFQDLTAEQAISIEGLGLSSLRIQDDYKRRYLSGAFSHLVGYVGLADKGDLEEKPELVFNDIVGKMGLERYYDDRLRGENGLRIVYRDFRGDPLGEREIRDAQVGDDVRTTIDGEFQEYFYRRFQQGLNALSRDSGVGLAINPQNGEVLAMLSFPSFDANLFSSSSSSSERVGLLTHKSKPLFNRAISGTYNPGSTIKPLVAFAALKEGVVDPLREIFSAGYIEILNPYFPENPSRFVDWKPHGWVNLYSALARSSNVYFYYLGGGFQDFSGLGVSRLGKYWELFGLGERTGINFPGEAVGFLPSAEEKEERTGSIWRVGDTYNVSIGQGDLLTTPIQLLTSLSTIANGGYLYQPTLTFDYINLAERLIADYSNDEVLFKEVRKGMEDVVSEKYGSAYLLADLPFAAAGKTGTPQVANNTRTNALFFTYAPAENPEIAVLVLVENAQEGSLNALPIAKDVLRWYYENRITDTENLYELQ